MTALSSADFAEPRGCKLYGLRHNHTKSWFWRRGRWLRWVTVHFYPGNLWRRHDGLLPRRHTASGLARSWIVDVERIEVLRGPQGTLYGARSMGGTVRIISKQPDLSTFYADVHGGLSDTWNTDRPNEFGEGSVNMPLVSGHLALRVDGFYDYEAGFFKREFPTIPRQAAPTTVDNVARPNSRKVAR